MATYHVKISSMILTCYVCVLWFHDRDPLYEKHFKCFVNKNCVCGCARETNSLLEFVFLVYVCQCMIGSDVPKTWVCINQNAWYHFLDEDNLQLPDVCNRIIFSKRN